MTSHIPAPNKRRGSKKVKPNFNHDGLRKIKRWKIKRWKMRIPD